MRNSIECFVLFIGILLIVKINAQAPRRDDDYPPREFLQRFIIIREVCKERSGVTEEAILEFSDGNIHEDEALKCYMNCLFHEVNVVDDNGELHMGHVRRFIPPELDKPTEKMFEQCIEDDMVGDSLCERAWWWHQCWKKADPVHYFLP